MASFQTDRPRNRLFAALPERDFARLRPELDTITFKPKEVLHRQHEPFDYVYFPTSGVFSMVTGFADGNKVESATVGTEGMVGIAAFLSDDPISPCESMLQVPNGEAQRLSVKALRRELAQQGTLHTALGRYVEVVIAHSLQSTACLALHPVQERCARWLLMTHDRMERDEFDLSQEFLAIMLGVSRQSVTVVAGALQMAGLIRYTHGHITVVDRTRLEAASCECYGMIRTAYDRLV
jgi:CRP-like cAMP-binding protein